MTTSPFRQRRLTRALAILAWAIGVAAWLPGSARGQERVAFIGVALDMETRQADRKLQDYLERKTNVRFAPEELEYGRVIDRLAHWRAQDGPFVARATPYVYVVAEMLGADFEILGTYVSAATGGRTYSSYLVVSRAAFATPPSLADVVQWLAARPERARFIYHNAFSTSSFFLPSLYFRSQRIYHMPERTESLIAIASERIPEDSSSKLVERVARGEADLAAVWDGTKNKAEQLWGAKVYFVRLPTALPNDLLVCSRSLDATVRDGLRDAVRGMGPAEIGVGDFTTWSSIRDASDARLALAELRWLARERSAPVTVETRLAAGSAGTPDALALLNAARQAVRLSGSELVLFDEDFHEHIDFTWTIEPIHDGAVRLRSSVPGVDLEDQVFLLSFRDPEDLTRRIVSLVQSRLHRLRYVWPWSGSTPIVIRDTSFTLPAGTLVKVQRISWLDPAKNKYRGGPVFDARIRLADYNKYELASEGFATGEQALSFDPLSNEAYRVLLPRASTERPLFRALTAAFVALFVLAAVLLVIDLRRARGAGAPSA